MTVNLMKIAIQSKQMPSKQTVEREKILSYDKSPANQLLTR